MDKEYNEFLENEIIERRREGDEWMYKFYQQLDENKLLVAQVRELKEYLDTIINFK